jgi:hypothetical protein
LTGPKTCGIRPGTSGPDIRTSAKRLGTARAVGEILRDSRERKRRISR